MKNKRIVVKIGTYLLAKFSDKQDVSDEHLDREYIRNIVSQVAELKKLNNEIIIITSGAITAGISRLGWKEKPGSLPLKQAASSVGQPLLMSVYEEYFSKEKIKVAQLLVTRDDFSDRVRYLNMRNTINTLLELGIVPIINENDTISTEEIKFGDNDTLSALVAAKSESDLLIILTDVDGLYSDDPRKAKNARFIEEVRQIDGKIEEIAKKNTGSLTSTGGMYTKIQSAKIATASGIETVIANGHKCNILIDILNGKKTGTRFLPQEKVILSRKKWIAFGKKIKGHIVIDNGAVDAIVRKGKSLLPSGIAEVCGKFNAGDTICINDKNNAEIGRGITYYSSDDIIKIKGKKTSQIKTILKGFDFEEVIHRDNMVILTER